MEKSTKKGTSTKSTKKTPEIPIEIEGTLLTEVVGLDIATAQLNRLYEREIYTAEQLLGMAPLRYLDCTTLHTYESMLPGETVAMVVQVVGRKLCSGMTMFWVLDSTGRKFTVKTFDSSIKNRVKDKMKYFICGKVGGFNGIKDISEIIIISESLRCSEDLEKYQKITPVYSKIDGISKEYLQSKIDYLVDKFVPEEYLTADGQKYFKVIDRRSLYHKIHRPKSMLETKEAQRRLLFDDLYSFAKEMKDVNSEGKCNSSYAFNQVEHAKILLKNQPFELTSDQKKVCNEIVLKTRKGLKVNGLVQGDVGSGKTIVAASLMFSASSNNYQSVLMAPTGVLAYQHYEEISKEAEKLGLKAVYLSSGMKAKERREVLECIKSGEVSFIVGTHAVLSDDVEFANLALVIIDEEHRFGVAQRKKLLNNPEIHCVSMTATPIPRTLATAIYGESIDIYEIKSKPSGRKPIKTEFLESKAEAYKLIEEQLKLGHQAYIICPLVDESTAEAVKDLTPLKKEYENAVKYFKNYKVGYSNGQMSRQTMDQEINKFKNKEYDIIIATTIIEVGVNVPNSTVILINDAERFGMATLHQLRGRVGRNSLQSYCYLLSKDKNNAKLHALTKTNDGFEVSKFDMELRGTGEFAGLKQSGDNKRFRLYLSSPKTYNKIYESLDNSLYFIEIKKAA